MEEKAIHTISEIKNLQSIIAEVGGKVPPNVSDIEEIVLGAILLEGEDALTKVMDILKPESFYVPKHAMLYEVFLALFEHSIPIDLVSVTRELQKRKLLQKAGGPAGVASLTSRVASAANIEYYARLIVEKYLMRELISLCSNTIGKAYDPATDAFELLDDTEKHLFKLADNRPQKDAKALSEIAIRVMERMETLKDKKEGITGVPSGFYEMDAITAGWQPSDFIVVAARPAMGKSAFMLSCAKNAAMDYGHPVLIFSLEMAAEQLVQRLISAEIQVNANKIRTGKLTPFEFQKFSDTLKKFSDVPIYINDAEGMSIYDIRVKARRLKVEKNIGMIIIDYLQLIREGKGKRNRNREQEIASISRSLKELAKELNIPVIALAQLSRQVESRPDKKPMLSDLRESGAIEQDADMVLFLYRPEYYGFTVDEEGNPTENVAYVIIGKHRNGPTGEVKLKFIKEFAKFVNPDEEESQEFMSAKYNPYEEEEIVLSSKVNDLNLEDDEELPPPPGFDDPDDAPPF